MLNQLEQVFSIQSTNLNDLDSDLDTTNNSFMPSSGVSAANNSNIISTETGVTSSSLFIANTSTNSSNNISLINKPISSLTNNNSIKCSTQMKNSGFLADQKVNTNATTSTSTSSDNSSTTQKNSILKDDDLTKQKRIEAISKHLKTDLIESFKSSNISAKLSLLQSPKLLKSGNMTEGFTFTNTSNDPQNSFGQLRTQLSFSQPQSSLMMQQQQNKNVMNTYNLNPLQHLDDNNVPNLTIDPTNSFPFQPQQQPHHLNQQHPNHIPAAAPQTGLLQTQTSHQAKSSRRMSLVSSNLSSNQINLNQMQLLNEDPTNGGVNSQVDLGDLQHNQQRYSFNNTTNSQTKKKLQERLQRNAANSISSTTSQVPNSNSPLITSSVQPASQPTQQISSNAPPSIPQITVQRTTDNNQTMLTSPNNNSSVQAQSIYGQSQMPRKINSNNNNESFYYSNANTTQMQHYKQNNNTNNSASYLNQPLINNMMPSQSSLSIIPPSSGHLLPKQLTVSPITSSPGTNAGHSPAQQSLSPSSSLQQQQQHIQHLHSGSAIQTNSPVQPILQSTSQNSQINLLNFNNSNTNNNPSQQVKKTFCLKKL